MKESRRMASSQFCSLRGPKQECSTCWWATGLRQWWAPVSEGPAGSQDRAGGGSITDQLRQHTQKPPRKATRDPVQRTPPTYGLSLPGFTSLNPQRHQAWNILGLITESLCCEQATTMDIPDIPGE